MSQNIDIGDRTKSSLFWNLSLPVLYQAVRLVISIIIARILDPKDFGILGIASAIVFYTNSLTNFGLSQALVQRKNICERHINSIFTINFSISIILSILTIMFSKDISIFFNTPESKNVFRALSAIFIITSFEVIPLSLLKREIRYKTISLIEFIAGGCQTGITLVMAILGFRYWSLVCGLLSKQVLKFILLNYRVKWVPRIKYEHKCVKEIFNFGWWNFLLAQSNFLSHYLDKFIIGKFLGPISLGYYDKAFSLAFMPIQAIAVKISEVMFASFSRNQDDINKAKEHFTKLISTTSLICFPIFLGMAVIAPFFVIILLGDKWKAMIVTLQILSLAFTFYSLTNIIGAINLGAGNYKGYIIIRLFGILFILLMCLFFVKKGIEVVSAIILIESFMMVILSFDITNRSLLIPWLCFIRAIIPPLSGAVIMFIIVKLLSFLVFGEINMMNLFILTSIGIMIYMTWVFIIDFEETRFLREELRIRVIKAKHMIMKSHS